ncbi:MAG: polyribonucleotide nucleotidyltransferase [Chloroflexi bacterium]|nr:polyribonucleotide nucleotidyltransferase [Chloroflexota bacterium]MBT3669224.1 polyribonucleotide nucleotidyltransferase [Chloroflexota bacterium]MBT4003174.1 polyribonucleotide nucleotidyltransferase [Chloroflexota bacterium]MBT4534968.1 polyribonucleotide nucleotidyltransferase [Chloroflexota bacterium]MBT4682290.1 polyribonucleotide nucleotidyltransferase [Chloroflexota bacterium]
MKPDVKQFSAEVGGKTFTYETGKLAGQAGGAVTLKMGKNIVFCSATMSSKPRDGINFFPLSVDFEERMYSIGKIPGSFFRREGRPTENAILTSRLTDRPLRPLFPKDMRNDVQVIIYAHSSDGDMPLDILAINSASAAVLISDAPWNGPVAAVRIGRIDDEFIVNPTYTELETSTLDLRVAGTKEAILMVEAGAEEISEEIMSEALVFAHNAMQPLLDAQIKMAAEVGKPKSEYPSFAVDAEIKEKVYSQAKDRLVEIAKQGGSLGKHARDEAVNELRNAVVLEVAGEEDADGITGAVKEAFEAANKKVVRDQILENGLRPDGRGTTDIRPIWCEVDYSPMAHGSGIFTRGETQVINFTTLGTPKDAQLIDNLTPVEAKRIMHHYNFPPFSVGETRMMRGTSRREVGHGALAERALIPVIPAEVDFPYSIRLVSECMSSNGSTSMGAVCSSTLSMMDAGVPIKAPVSGIAMGMISDGDNYKILSDIQGLEDHLGDMDFKVAGTDKGITALQMDIKVDGLTPEMMGEALQQAKAGRSHILNTMLETISVPRPELKEHTPRITTVVIPVEKIGAVIGSGGKTIRSIQEETGAKIDIGEDGTVFISTNDGDSERAARERIEALTEDAEMGRIYTGKVVRTTDFGAFVEIFPGTDGMVHISQLDSERIESVEDVASVGDEITVMVTNIGGDGKIRLSRKAVLEGWTAEEAAEKDRGGGKKGGGDRNRSGGNRGRGGRR